MMPGVPSHRTLRRWQEAQAGVFLFLYLARVDFIFNGDVYKVIAMEDEEDERNCSLEIRLMWGRVFLYIATDAGENC